MKSLIMYTNDEISWVSNPKITYNVLDPLPKVFTFNCKTLLSFACGKL